MSKQTFSFITVIEANNEDHADNIREEMVGSAEDVMESGARSRGAEVWSTSLEGGDQSAKIELYRSLHDQVSDLVEDGKLQALKDADPNAYAALVSSLEHLAGIDPKPMLASKPSI